MHPPGFLSFLSGNLSIPLVSTGDTNYGFETGTFHHTPGFLSYPVHRSHPPEFLSFHRSTHPGLPELFTHLVTPRVS
jgi:hypothetical protein